MRAQPTSTRTWLSLAAITPSSSLLPLLVMLFLDLMVLIANPGCVQDEYEDFVADAQRVVNYSAV